MQLFISANATRRQSTERNFISRKVKNGKHLDGSS
jgi:hypothetical protein